MGAVAACAGEEHRLGWAGFVGWGWEDVERRAGRLADALGWEGGNG